MKHEPEASESQGVLHNERLRIRPWKTRDDMAQQAWPPYTDPCYTLWNIPRHLSLYNSLLPFSSNGTGGRRVWAIEEHEGRLIGRISLRDIDQHTRQARLGISLSSACVGQGLGTEAMILFLDYFFGQLDFDTMMLDVAAFNRRAVYCYERLGFRQVSDEWRRSSMQACLRTLETPAHRHLLRYFRRDRWHIWVQFLEMELKKEEWLTGNVRRWR